ncbi:putative protein N(5)-glutamine methyltransferase [Actinophytocola sp.]|uniref:putative protein N(5)-glutamine methyltransferase n=1 Tax=Actinophytocola sp. TaxID=1872138 RepID=UPI002D7EBC42|nr:putative protein N(5)-glutamine methyltransferase [Actinophytocola sp.]HET9139353.1 putative protein N(5)-glutamine methyltransferase [Actinophytocola sp.]
MVDQTVAALRAAGCVFAEDEARLLHAAADDPAGLAALLARRVAGEPLEHVLGWASFHGLRIAVTPGVFVPRPRTEFLVDLAAGLARPGALVVDLCCGSGALGAALVAVVPGARVHAADVDPVAVRCARRNLPDHQVYQGDLTEPLPTSLRGKVDLMVANVPYVPTAEVALLPPEAREHEPLRALDGGTDGLDLLRRVATLAPAWLAPGAHLLIETSTRQAPTAAEAFRTAGLRPEVAESADFGATVVIGAMQN